MSELTHPLAAQPQAPPSRRSGGRTRRTRRRSPSSSTRISPGGSATAARPANGNDATSLPRDAHALRARHGEVVSAYWCTHVESAAALTERKRRVSWATPVSTFHRESDWATKHAPDIARELYRCDELAVRARDRASRACGSASACASSCRRPRTCSASSTRAPRTPTREDRAALEQERERARQGRGVLLQGRERPGADRLLHRDGLRRRRRSRS